MGRSILDHHNLLEVSDGALMTLGSYVNVG